jgi:hypothetical protein
VNSFVLTFPLRHLILVQTFRMVRQSSYCMLRLRWLLHIGLSSASLGLCRLGGGVLPGLTRDCGRRRRALDSFSQVLLVESGSRHLLPLCDSVCLILCNHPISSNLLQAHHQCGMSYSTPNGAPCWPWSPFSGHLSFVCEDLRNDKALVNTVCCRPYTGTDSMVHVIL